MYFEGICFNILSVNDILLHREQRQLKNDKLEGIFKKAAMAYSGNYPGIFLDGSMKTS
jgi:hypothetical protein